MSVAACSGGQELLYTADTLLHPLHREHPEWCAIGFADMDREQVTFSRRCICDRAAAENALVLAYHFPFPGLGYIRRSATAWQWEPIAT